MEIRAAHIIALVLFSLAWLCNAVMDTIKYHWHSTWLYDLFDKDGAIHKWLFADWTTRHQYLLGYDGWHTFKGLMLLFIAAGIGVLTEWWFGLLVLLLYSGIFEGFFGHVFLRKQE
jgi:hypothetical protein